MLYAAIIAMLKKLLSFNYSLQPVLEGFQDSKKIMVEITRISAIVIIIVALVIPQICGEMLVIDL